MAESKTVTAKKNDPMELVAFKLHRRNPSDKVKGIYVNVNTKNHFIPYGKVVDIPRYVAEVIERSIASDEATADKMQEFSEAAEKREKEIRLGIA